jgi:hypothetical protein
VWAGVAAAVVVQCVLIGVIFVAIREENSGTIASTSEATKKTQ